MNFWHFKYLTPVTYISNFMVLESPSLTRNLPRWLVHPVSLLGSLRLVLLTALLFVTYEVVLWFICDTGRRTDDSLVQTSCCILQVGKK